MVFGVRVIPGAVSKPTDMPTQQTYICKKHGFSFHGLVFDLHQAFGFEFCSFGLLFRSLCLFKCMFLDFQHGGIVRRRNADSLEKETIEERDGW